MAPQLSGTLTDHGVPVAGAELMLVSGFTTEKANATTDAEGRFTIGPLTSWEAFIVMGEPEENYSLSIDANGNSYTGYSVLTMYYTPRVATLSCDLAKYYSDQNWLQSPGHGVCIQSNAR